MFDYLRLQRLRYVTLHAYRSGDWRKILITENNDRLVEVPREIAFPYYAREMQLVKHDVLYLRSEVLERVLWARTILEPQGFDLKIYDGWRSIELQENLFWYYMRAFTAAKFGQGDEFGRLKEFADIKAYFNSLPPDLQTTMREANRTYVSWPSSNPISPSPHATGGSVDVWLFRGDEAVNLGVPFDWMEENAGAFYHLKLRRQRFRGNDQQICRNRAALLLAMSDAGFSCYGPEIWHFNYGNQMDALVKGGPAMYSYIEPQTTI
jgi:zinc D-Ala-D-Ala dipeptidase